MLKISHRVLILQKWHSDTQILDKINSLPLYFWGSCVTLKKKNLKTQMPEAMLLVGTLTLCIKLEFLTFYPNIIIGFAIIFVDNLTIVFQKTATAVAHCKRGHGLIKVNGRPLEHIQPKTLQFKLQEPILLLGKVSLCNSIIYCTVNTELEL
jgi:hypothetical protein